MKSAFNVLGGTLLAVAAACVAAQDAPYPKRGNIEMTVLFPAGTSADVTARLLAQGMSKHLGTNIVIVNRPGAGGAIGYKHLASQKPDGYAIVWNSNSISTTHHSGQLPFDYRTFDAVARVLSESVVIAVRNEARWKSLKELIADAKGRPGEITVANSGVGSHTHMSAVALFRAVDAKSNDVPFAAAQIIPSLMGGHVDVAVQFPGALASNVQAGKLRLLASLTAARDPVFPDVPTAREMGVDVVLEAWRGIAAPKGIPPAVLQALQESIRRTVESPEFAQGAERLFVRPAYLPAAEFAEMIAREDAGTARIMQAIGLKK